MSQNSLVLPTSGTLSGLQLVNDVNNSLDTLNTKFSGTAAPSGPETAQDWADTSAGGSLVNLRAYDGAQWPNLAVLDGANHVMRPQYVPFYKTAAKSSAYSVTAADHGTLFTVTGTTTLTLPTAASVWAGFTVTVVNLDTTGGTTPLITTVTASGGAGIYFPSANASVTSLPLANTGSQVTFVSNGTNWIALGVTLEIAFSTALTSAQSVANNTLTKVQLNSKNKDVGGYFDATTNFRYTPLVPGLYAFAGFLSFTTEVNATGYMVAIYKNATTYMGRADGVASGTAVQGEGVTAIVAMNGTTDFIELYTQQTSGGALTASSTNQTTQLSGYRLA